MYVEFLQDLITSCNNVYCCVLTVNRTLLRIRAQYFQILLRARIVEKDLRVGRFLFYITTVPDVHRRDLQHKHIM